MKGNFKMCSN